MTDDELDDAFARALARRAHPMQGEADEAAAEDPEVMSLLEAVDLAWESQQVAPPLAEDPTARMLGLVPNADDALDGKAAASARKKAGLSLSALVERLQARGWEVTSNVAFGWENGAAYDAPPSLITAIAEEIGVQREMLAKSARPDPARVALASVLSGEAFAELASRWAALKNTSISTARDALEARLAVAVHRGGPPNPAAAIASLEALVSSLEEQGDSRA